MTVVQPCWRWHKKLAKDQKLQRKRESLIKQEARQDLNNRYSTTQVFISPVGDWTRGLREDLLSSNHHRGCWVRGPYTSPFFVAKSFSNLLLVASGIGISPSLGAMGQYPGHSRVKILIWLVKNRDMLRFFAPLLKDAHMSFVFYTGKDKLSEGEKRHLQSHGKIFIKQSRPDSLEETLESVIANYEQSFQEVRNLTHTSQSIGRLMRITKMEHISRDKKSAWCIFYCGGSKILENKMKDFSKENGTGFHSEVFDW